MTDQAGNGRRDAIPEELRDFVRDFIDSISSLEVLLLLREHRPNAMTAEQLTRELRSNPAHTLVQLERLRGLSLAIHEENGYVYAPDNPRLEALVEALAVHYTTHRVSMINLIYNPNRGPQEIKQFADAFKLRKD